MARHIHIFLPARVRDTAPAPAKHPPAAVSELVERLMQAIADRSGKKTTDAGFDESKVKRDAGGQFSAHGGSGQAAAKHHEEMAAKHHEAAKQDFAPRKDHERAAQLHQNAGKEAIMHLTHGTPYEHYSNAASIAAGKSAAMGLGGSAASPKGEINQVTGKPTSATAKGAKAGTHELLSSGHPFSMDELVKATGSSKASVMTALSDLKNPKYAGSKGALNIVKRADGSYHVQKSDAPAPAAKTQSKNPGGFNTSQPDPKAAKPVAHASATGQSFLPKVKTSQVNTNTKAGSNLLGSFLKNENSKAASAQTSKPGNITKTATGFTATSPDGKERTFRPHEGDEARLHSIGKLPTFPPMSAHGEAKGVLHLKAPVDSPAARSAYSTVNIDKLKQALGAKGVRLDHIGRQPLVQQRNMLEELAVYHSLPVPRSDDKPTFNVPAPPKGSLEERIQKNQSLGMGPETAKRMAITSEKRDSKGALRGGAQAAMGNHSQELLRNAMPPPQRQSTGFVNPGAAALMTPNQKALAGISKEQQRKDAAANPPPKSDRPAGVHPAAAPKPSEPAPHAALHKVLTEATSAYGGESYDPKKVEAAAKYMQGKTGVDILKLADSTGLSVGQAKHLNEARKEHFRNQGASGNQTRAERIDNSLKQKWIGPVRR